jgi:hypothetical protein
MLLLLTKIHRKMIGIYAQILLHDLSCRPGGGSQKDRALMPPRAVPAQEHNRQIIVAKEFQLGGACETNDVAIVSGIRVAHDRRKGKSN